MPTIFNDLQQVRIAVRVENLSELNAINKALGLKSPVPEPKQYPVFIAVYGKEITDEPDVALSMRSLLGYSAITAQVVLSGAKPVEKNWQGHVNEEPNDLNILQFRFAVFNFKDNRIYKLMGLDFRANRFDLSGDRMTQWINFNQGVMFDFTNQQEFDYYYSQHIKTTSRPQTKDQILTWLCAKSARVSFIKEDPEESK